MSADQRIRLNFDGQDLTATAGTSLIQAWIESGRPLVDNVGCMGQGVCGACRVLVRRAGVAAVETALACETPAEDGMQVAAVDYFPAHRPHHYDLQVEAEAGDAERLNEIFPEAAHCRHCGGCDRACPRDIEVERMVNLAAAGRIDAAAPLFDHCVMCNLCVAACPEDIDPAHLGQFVRRMTAATAPMPADLDQRLQEIRAGGQPLRLPTAGDEPES